MNAGQCDCLLNNANLALEWNWITGTNALIAFKCLNSAVNNSMGMTHRVQWTLATLSYHSWYFNAISDLLRRFKFIYIPPPPPCKNQNNCSTSLVLGMSTWNLSSCFLKMYLDRSKDHCFNFSWRNISGSQICSSGFRLQRASFSLHY